MSEGDVFEKGDSFDDILFNDINESPKKSDSDISFSDLPPLTLEKPPARSERDEFDDLPPLPSAQPQKRSVVNFSALADAAKQVEQQEGMNTTAPILGGRAPLLPPRLAHSSDPVVNQEAKTFDLPPLFSDIDLSEDSKKGNSNNLSEENHISSEVASESEPVKPNLDDEIIMIGGDSGDELFQTKSTVPSRKPSLIASVIQEVADKKRETEKAEESDASIGFETPTTTAPIISPKREPELSVPVPVAQKQDTFPTDNEPSDDPVPAPVPVVRTSQGVSPEKVSTKEEQPSNTIEEKKVAGATEAQLSSVSLPLYSEPTKKEKDAVVETAKPAMELTPMAIETEIGAYLDRAITGFHRLFFNEFAVVMRPSQVQYNDDERIDAFLEVLQKEVTEEIARTPAPNSPTKNTVDKKIQRAFDEAENDVRTLLSSHRESYKKKEEQTVRDMKFLCHQIDALNDQFRHQSGQSMRILKDEIKGSALMRTQNEAQQISRVARVREMMLTRLELEAKLNRQIHEQEDFERAAARARIGMYNNTSPFQDDDSVTVSPYSRAIELELQNLEEIITRDDGYKVLCELNNKFSEARSTLQKECVELLRACQAARNSFESRRNKIRLQRVRSADHYDDVERDLRRPARKQDIV